jgi:hypothetical protein
MASVRFPRSVRALTALVVLLLTTGAAPLDRAPDPVPTYAPVLDRDAGRPGEFVAVNFPTDVSISRCSAGFGRPLQRCDNRTVLLRVPPRRAAEMDVVWEVTPKGDDVLPVPKEGVLPFRVLDPAFDVSVEPAQAHPDDHVTAHFRSRDDQVQILACAASIGPNRGSCDFTDDRWTARVRVPAGGDELTWTVTYGVGTEDEGSADGTLPFRVVPLPPPEFSVTAEQETAAPGDPVTVHFVASTAGITIEDCAASFGMPVSCDDSGTAVLRVPSTATPGSTISLGWELSYTSTRTGEEPGRRSSKIAFLVAPIVVPEFAVTVQPRAAAPGRPVTVVFTSLTKGVDITGCLAAFAHDAGAECRRSRDRWVARTTVPRDARPGSSLLRWGIASRDGSGKAGADNGVIEYEILRRPTPEPAVPTASADRPLSSAAPSSAAPSAGPSSAGPSVGPSSAGPSSGLLSAVPLPVPLSDGPSSGPSSAGPSSAGPSAGPTGSPGSPSPGVTRPPPVDEDELVAAFSVLPAPAAARAGEHVTVSQASLVDGVTISGCSAGFTPAGMTPCRQTPQGWAAEVLVPKDIPVGRGTVQWNLVYQRTGSPGSGSTDGLLTFTVLGAEPTAAGWGAKLLGTGGKVLLGTLALAALVGSRGVRRRLGGWRDRLRPNGTTAPDEPSEPPGPRVVPMLHAERMAVHVTDAAAPPEHLIRITTRAPLPDPVVREEMP